MRKLFLWLLALGLLLSGCGQAGEPAAASAFLLDTAVSVRIYEGEGGTLPRPPWTCAPAMRRSFPGRTRTASSTA